MQYSVEIIFKGGALRKFTSCKDCFAQFRFIRLSCQILDLFKYTPEQAYLSRDLLHDVMIEQSSRNSSLRII